MRHVFVLCLTLWLFLALSPPGLAEPIELQSATTQASLLELYTSEGCSSCPPADRWLSGLKRDSRLWRQLVPVAFHVDYWDYIGWPDRFAEPAYGQRQRAYAEIDALSQVYTPGLLVAGREWRAWFFRPELILEAAPEVGRLAMLIDDDNCIVRFSPQPITTEKSEKPEQLELHLAVLGFELSTAVKAGENKGRRLEHDFVVLGYRHELLQWDQTAARYSVTTTLPVAKFPSARRAIAAWVSRAGDPRPLQALGGWL